MRTAFEDEGVRCPHRLSPRSGGGGQSTPSLPGIGARPCPSVCRAEPAQVKINGQHTIHAVRQITRLHTTFTQDFQKECHLARTSMLAMMSLMDSSSPALLPRCKFQPWDMFFLVTRNTSNVKNGKIVVKRPAGSMPMIVQHQYKCARGNALAHQLDCVSKQRPEVHRYLFNGLHQKFLHISSDEDRLRAQDDDDQLHDKTPRHT